MPPAPQNTTTPYLITAVLHHLLTYTTTPQFTPLQHKHNTTTSQHVTLTLKHRGPHSTKLHHVTLYFIIVLNHTTHTTSPPHHHIWPHYTHRHHGDVPQLGTLDKVVSHLGVMVHSCAHLEGQWPAQHLCHAPHHLLQASHATHQGTTSTLESKDKGGEQKCKNKDNLKEDLPNCAYYNIYCRESGRSPTDN